MITEIIGKPWKPVQKKTFREHLVQYTQKCKISYACPYGAFVS